MATDFSGRCPVCGDASGTLRLPLDEFEAQEWEQPGHVANEWTFCIEHRVKWRDYVLTVFSCLESTFADELRLYNDVAAAEAIGLESFDEIDPPEVELALQD